ncbi:MAG: 2-oxoglutarate:ferredoxin oxidoreductase [Nitrospinae bacterium]|nr:2-oxoglutarate:ferredoxin oxidoreductase [Nitrospinota bacterium]MBL7019137.1 2-oxoglutarate:ferredoxin oxidoreductase [Nitrospinaceae bacterium]
MPTLELGPIGLLPPSAAMMGIFQPDKDSGMDLVEGKHVLTDDAIKKAAHEILTRRNPTLFPGPMIVWGWNDETMHKAEMAMDLVREVPGMNVIPMPDYRPIYPKIDPEAVINPCHPNLTVQHNKIETCILIGVHCHFANVTLKMIRANTNCYTMAFCAYDGHEDALISLRDLDGAKLLKVTEAVRQAKKEGVEPWGLTKAGKDELEETAARKKAELSPSKENTTLFMGELEQGLDENAE